MLGCVAVQHLVLSHGSGAESSRDFVLASFGDDDHFAGRIRLPLPETFSDTPADWEEWSWNFKAYISMFEPSAVRTPDAVETPNEEYVDAALNVLLDTGDIDEERSAG